MEKYFKKSILDEIYEAKGDQFADNILKEMDKQNKEMVSLSIGKKLTEKIKENVTDEKKQKEILDLLNEYEMKSGDEDDFWNKMYYKLGVYDCTEIKEILKDNVNEYSMKDIFLDDYSDELFNYINSNIRKTLKENAVYKELSNKIEKIKVNNPKVRDFLENRELVKLSNVDKDAILKILNLQGDIDAIEFKETFKLGAREIILFLKQMNLL